MLFLFYSFETLNLLSLTANFLIPHFQFLNIQSLLKVKIKIFDLIAKIIIAVYGFREDFNSEF